MSTELEVVKAWHEVVNAGDIDRLATLVHEDIEVGGPRGSGYGIALLRDWVVRAGVRFEPQRFFQRGDEVVVEQRAIWRLPETGETGEPQKVASSFLVRGGRVQRVMRYPDLGTALTVAELDESNAVPEGSDGR